MSKSIAPVAKADGDESLGSKTPCVSASCSFALQLRLEEGQNMQLLQLKIGDFVEFVPLEVLAASEFDIRLSARRAGIALSSGRNAITGGFRIGASGFSFVLSEKAEMGVAREGQKGRGATGLGPVSLR